MNDTIAKILNLTPVEVKQEPTKVVPAIAAPHPKTNEDQLENDFEYARRNMYDIIEKGQEALIGIMDVAGQSQHPRAYEVMANLIKTMAETNKDLLDLNKKKRDMLPKEEAPKQMANNMAVFVGSTSELQAMLMKKKTEE